MNDSKSKNILLLSIIGDALGSTCEGLSRGHIQSLAGDRENYFDPPVKKIDAEKWRKPGLYTSISQLMLLLSFSNEKKIFTPVMFIKNIGDSPRIEDTGSGIFRHTGHIENNLIDNVFNRSPGSSMTQIRSARVLPLVVPLSLSGTGKENIIYSAAGLISLFTGDHLTVSGGILLALIIHSLVTNGENEMGSILDLSLELNRGLEQFVEKHSSAFFEMKINPEMLISSCRVYTEFLDELRGAPDKEAGERIIYSRINASFKMNIKKATIDNPLAILPYSLVLLRHYRNSPSGALQEIAREGGASSALTSISGALLGCHVPHDIIPGALINNLVNKKRIRAAIDMIISGHIPDGALEDFLMSESRLTMKEIEEYRARQKKNKSGGKDKKTKRDRDYDLSRHVVESWTKLDKAKWKKSKKNLPDFEE